MNKTIKYNTLQNLITRLKYQKTIIILLSIILMFMSFTIMLQSIQLYKADTTSNTSSLISNKPINDIDYGVYIESLQD